MRSRGRRGKEMQGLAVIVSLLAMGAGLAAAGLVGMLTGLVAVIGTGSGLAIAAAETGTAVATRGPVRVAQRLGGLVSAIACAGGAYYGGWALGWIWGGAGYLAGMGTFSLLNFALGSGTSGHSHTRIGGLAGGLVTNVQNIHSSRSYVVSTAPEVGRDYWSTAVLNTTQDGGTDFQNPVASFIRNDQASAHSVHEEIVALVGPYQKVAGPANTPTQDHPRAIALMLSHCLMISARPKSHDCGRRAHGTG